MTSGIHWREHGPDRADATDFVARHWWLLPCMLLLWELPYLLAHRTYAPLALELAFLTVLLALRQVQAVFGATRLLWPLALAALLAFVSLEGLGSLAGTLVFLASIYLGGFCVDGLFLANSTLGRLSRESVFLRVPFLFAQGTFVQITLFCLLGAFVPVQVLFLGMPLACAGGALWAWRRHPPRAEARPAAPDRGWNRTVILLLVLLPLSLAFHKALIFYKYDCSGHDEVYVPLVASIAKLGNLPVSLAPAILDSGLPLTPYKGKQYSLERLQPFIKEWASLYPPVKDPTGEAARGGKGSGGLRYLFPNHFGGEVLAAYWVYLSGANPAEVYRLIQVVACFHIVGWALLVFYVMFGSLGTATLVTAMIWIRLFEDDYIDMDIHNMAMLGLLWATYTLLRSPPQTNMTVKEATYWLVVLLGTVYACYPITFVMVFPVLGLCLLVHEIMCRRKEASHA